ncbi:hypothetical protein Pmani_017500, partial [Petrolisthes manimaculis]
MEVEGG